MATKPPRAHTSQRHCATNEMRASGVLISQLFVCICDNVSRPTTTLEGHYTRHSQSSSASYISQSLGLHYIALEERHTRTQTIIPKNIIHLNSPRLQFYWSARESTYNMYVVPIAISTLHTTRRIMCICKATTTHIYALHPGTEMGINCVYKCVCL